ncbi:MAG: gamma-glutamyl-gamma-aminobutyrate hydrolase family protein [Bdellovibrionota bacterium]
MKKILVTQRLESIKAYGEVRDQLDVAWHKLLAEAGYLCVPFPSHVEIQPFIEAIKPDGLILSGGNDLAALNDNLLNRKRDQVETELLNTFKSKNLPVLGVCRGAQFIAHQFGAELEKVDGHVTCSHELEVLEGNILTPLLKCNKVNSYHNFAITSLKAPLIPTAICSDKTIEAFEHQTLPIYGILWHPERGETESTSFSILQMIFG